jgi:FKBP-type peptidyl-prolyl cis-trans isomerase FklB
MGLRRIQVKTLAVSLFTTVLITNVYAAEKSVALKDQTAKINYSVGYQIGSDFQYQEIESRPEAVIKGIQDALSDSEPLMTTQEMRKTMGDLGKHVAELKKKKRAESLQLQIEKNRQFLEQNAKRVGITTTASGLQYRVLEQGGGKHPQLSDNVLVHYRGKLINGTEFDSSYSRNKPTSFQVDQVIKGWTEALQLMQRGDHWQLFIPSELAYGEDGAGAKIPPHSTLIFDVELISIH